MDAWSQFRGANGQGTARLSGFPIPLERRHIVWRTDIAPGVSSPIVLPDGAVALTAFENGRIVLLCIDPRRGAVRWKVAAPAGSADGVHAESSPAAATPATDGERLVVFVPGFGLWACDRRGRELWRTPLEMEANEHGLASSPILHAGRVFQMVSNNGRGKGYLCALDVRTGKTLWKRARPLAPASWSTPVLWHASEGTELLALGTLLESFDPESGERLWAITGFGEQPVTHPIVDGDTIFVNTNGYAGFSDVGLFPAWEEIVPRYDRDGDARLSAAEFVPEIRVVFRKELSPDLPWNALPVAAFFAEIDANQDAKITQAEWQAFWQGGAKSRVLALRREGGVRGAPRPLWESGRGVSEIPSPVRCGRHLFTIRDGGRLTCFAADSGRVLFEERVGAGGQYLASPVAIALPGGRTLLVLCSARGVVTLAWAQDRLALAGSLDLGETIKATPALDERWNRMYLRTERALYAFASRP